MRPSAAKSARSSRSAARGLWLPALSAARSTRSPARRSATGRLPHSFARPRSSAKSAACEISTTPLRIPSSGGPPPGHWSGFIPSATLAARPALLHTSNCASSSALCEGKLRESEFPAAPRQRAKTRLDEIAPSVPSVISVANAQRCAASRKIGLWKTWNPPAKTCLRLQLSLMCLWPRAQRGRRMPAEKTAQLPRKTPLLLQRSVLSQRRR